MSSELHLVTGGCGFLGGALVKRLLDQGVQVRVLDVWEDPQRDTRAELVLGDVTDPRTAEQALRGVDKVHHHAALVPATRAGTRFWQVNVDGTRTMLEAAKAAKVKQFIHLSSSAVFGGATSDQMPVRAETPMSPVEDYGGSKAEADRLVLKAMGEGFPCAIIRPRTILGPGRLGIFRILFDWVREGRRVYMIGDGSNKFQFIHIDDLLDAILACTRLGRTGVFQIGTDTFGTMREALQSLCSHAGTGARLTPIPIGLAAGALRLVDILGISPLGPYHYKAYHKDMYFDLAREKRELEWSPRYSNKQIMTQTYDAYLEALKSGRLSGSGSSFSHKSGVGQGVLKLLKWLP